jgi:hypothetical protein
MNPRKPSRRTTEANQESESIPVAKLEPEIKAKIGDQLRSMYNEVVGQGVPDRFAEILSGLDHPTHGGAKNEPR